MVLGKALKTIDVFRHVPNDLTESTKIGGTVTIAAIGLLVTLFYLEVSSLLSISSKTSIHISHREDEDFRVNVNITFPGISCNWLSVDLLDVVGHKKTNITSSGFSTISKYTLHGSYVATAVRQYDQSPPPTSTEVAVDDSPDSDGDDRPRVVELTKDNFRRVIDEHRVVVVNFYAPWCPYCVALAPIYEQAARKVEQELKRDKGLVLAAVNCIDAKNSELCHLNHIQAFPTLRIYRDGTDNPKEGHKHMHEEYNGNRRADDISQYALNALKETREEHHKDEAALAEAESRREYASYGCVVAGHVKASRVPGSLIFSPHAAGHDFMTEAINMSHVISHLSFGNHPLKGQKLPKRLKKKIPQDMGGVYASDKEDHSTLFVSLSDHVTHEHYIKVVPTIFEPVSGPSVETYEYTVNSNLYASEKGRVPAIKLVWDIWPMEIVNKDYRRPLIEGVCQIVGFLGGVFTFFLVVERLTTGAWQRFVKASQGKLG
eukprot:TRINITY_DN114166_c0_g1_i1.p1 TRINITY_DN114166_c0_g1~~TRINITY_DN114166_c0_g1_i1.p1  ORF type:complete len:489 (+),score=35.04 TRINITY_DN114166_c0_g1_i1:65-1531(+)